MSRKNILCIFIFFLSIIIILSQPILCQDPSQSEDKKIEPLSQWSKQWLEEVVPYIITGTEKKIFINLPTEVERGKFIQNFWKKRDPNPTTSENEFKMEYYKRIALANKFFGFSGIDGWRTDRGKIFILLGPPQEIQRDMSPSGLGYSGFRGPKEIWNYWGLPNPRLPYNLEFVFVDNLGTGNFALERSVRLGDAGSQNINIDSSHLYFDYLETLAEATRNPFEGLNRLKGIITTQVTYDRIPIDYNHYHLKASEEKTYIFLAVKAPYSAVTQKEIENEHYINLTLLINVSDRLGRIIYERSKDINFKHTREGLEALKGESFQIQASISLEPEDYKIHFLVLDNFSGKIGTLHSNLSDPNSAANL